MRLSEFGLIRNVYVFHSPSNLSAHHNFRSTDRLKQVFVPCKRDQSDFRGIPSSPYKKPPLRQPIFRSQMIFLPTLFRPQESVLLFALFARFSLVNLFSAH